MSSNRSHVFALAHASLRDTATMSAMLLLALGGLGRMAAATPTDCPRSDHECSEVGGPGCLDTDCCKVVCGVDLFCCVSSWDLVCVDEAARLCTPVDPCTTADHDCFTPGGPGCTDAECCASVCAVNPFCCTNSWDGVCVGAAGDTCASPGPPSACETCCGKTPSVSGFGGHPVVLGTDSGDSPSSFVLHVFDVSGFASQVPGGTPGWVAPRYENPMWTQQVLGTVFGVTADDAGNMYLSNGIWYPIHDKGTLGGDEGAVTRIDGATGNATLLVNLPQAPLAPPMSPGGLGNLTWSCAHQSLYVTNFADGRVYRIDPSAPPGQRIKSAWDFDSDALDLSGNPEVGDPPGPVGYGERVWGIAVAGDKMFVSQWNRDWSNPGNGQNNKIWSVQLDALGNPMPGSKVMEIELMGAPKSAVSDLAFDAQCCLYAAQKTINQPLGLNCSGAHASNLLKFCWQPSPGGGQWAQSGIFEVGDSNPPLPQPPEPDSTAGGVGVDNASGGLVWATGDYLQIDPLPAPMFYTYGATGLAQTGGNSSNYIAVDFDGDVSVETPAYDKREIGSCEVICSDGSDVGTCTEAPIPANLVLWLPFDEPVGQPIAQNPPGSQDGVPQAVNEGQSGMVGLSRFTDHGQIIVPSYHALEDSSLCSDLTIDAWVRMISTDLTPIGYVWSIVDKSILMSGTFRGYRFSIKRVNSNPSGVHQLILELGDGANASTYMGPIVDLGPSPTPNWHFIAVTVDRCDGSPNGPTVMFHHDGVMYPAAPVLAPYVTGYLNSAAPVSVLEFSSGTAPAGQATANYLGWIDEVEIFRRALTSDEVLQLWDAKDCGKAKRFCIVPQVSSGNLAQPGSNSVGALVRICNVGPSATFNYTFTGLPAGGCGTIAGPTIFNPPSGSIFVAQGECKSVFVQISPPAGLTGANIACYRMDVSDNAFPATFKPFACFGGITNSFPLSWTTSSDTTSGFAGSSFTGGCDVSNDGVDPISLSYRILVTGPDMLPDFVSISLDGMAPGEEVTGTIALQPGQQATLNFTATMVEFDPLRPYTILVEWEVDGTGTFVPVLAIPLVFGGGEPCLGDLDGSGVIDGADLGLMLGSWGRPGAADLNASGVVDGADLGLLLGAWGPCL